MNLASSRRSEEEQGISPVNISIKGKQIGVTDVSKTFVTRDGKEVVALDRTSFQIAGGEFVSVVGPSGCGKSTVMRIIAGLIKQSAGSARLGDRQISGVSREIGIAFQKSVLLPWLNIRRNIALPAELEGGWKEEDLSRRVDELLKIIRLEGIADRYPNELSGGMQQRVSIARSLMCDPSVLLMDEPFGALDALTREHMHDELLSIWNKSRPTVVFITHDISEAIYLSDRILVMAARPGRIIADIKVNLPRDRTPDLRGTPEFGSLGAEVRSLIAH
jgi:NitT/TauT family transport system ATP-binding protein